MRHKKTLAFVLAAACLLLTLAADQPPDDYLRARVAAAIALNTRNPPAPGPAASAVTNERKPVVFVYLSPDWKRKNACPPCKRLVADVENWTEAPCRFILDAKPPDGFDFDGYPCLHWNDRRGTGRKIEGWTNRADFLATWNATEKGS